MLNADKLCSQIRELRYPQSGRDTQHELDVVDVFINNGFTQVDSRSSYRTKEQRRILRDGMSLNDSAIAKAYPKGLFIIHHPLGKRSHPDFALIVNGNLLLVEAKSSSSGNDYTKCMFGNTLLNPHHEHSFFIFTHKNEGTELLLTRDLITVSNYLLLQKHKRERDELQAKQDAEFMELCGGVGVKHYNRVNYTTSGGKEYNYISKAKEENLAEHVVNLLKKYE